MATQPNLDSFGVAAQTLCSEVAATLIGETGECLYPGGFVGGQVRDTVSLSLDEGTLLDLQQAAERTECDSLAHQPCNKTFCIRRKFRIPRRGRQHRAYCLACQRSRAV